MQIIVNADDKPEHIRLAASFLLHLIGDLKEDAPAPAAAAAPPPPPPPPLLTGADASLSSVLKPGASEFASPAPSVDPPPPPPPPAIPPAAPAPVVSAAVVTTQTQSAPAAGAPELDSAGLPWDARIHQVKRAKKKDGTWKIQKGADPTLVAAVIKELAMLNFARPVYPAPATPASPPAAAPPPPPPPPPPPAAGAPVPPPPAATSTGFRELITKISNGTKAGKLTPASVAAIVQAHGCPSLQALRDMPQLIPLVETDIDVAVLS